ncbi:cell division control protein 25 [[Candida] railenensis]|uniref:Cell division control protein 25 n=1 Tax=[Candida] railenensis TaxID=45579 RepID=A0A9P0VY23_9ASCO|nr:cell division control protein 25 [[Candida] railenensis]
MSSYDEIAPDAISPGDFTSGLNTTPDRPLKHLDTVVALYDFPGTQNSHLPLNLGDTVFVLSKSPSGWWDGVIVAQNGELLRGWFPKNYVRSVNYVQPVLNKLKSNKEIDSITAANTAANVLIPSFTTLLQKNLIESEKSSTGSNTRKNSVVSFASSDTSDKQSSSQSQPQSQLQSQQIQSSAPPTLNLTSFPTSASTSQSSNQSQNNSLQPAPQTHLPSTSSSSYHQQSVTTITSDFKGEDSVFNTVDDVEKIIEDFRENDKDFEGQLTWIGKITSEGNWVYYNEKLDIYSSNLPLSTYDSKRDFDLHLEIPSMKNLLDVSVISTSPYGENPLSQNEPNHRSGSNSSVFTVSENIPGGTGAAHTTSEDGVGSSSLKSRHSHNSREDLKRESNASSVNSQGSGNSLYHHFHQPFFAMENLFYKHPGDISSWTALGEKFQFLLDLSWRALQENNKQLFSTHFTRLNKMISILFSCLRLQHNDYVGTKYERTIRRKLKKIAACYTRIYTNGLLHLSVMHYNSSLDSKLFSLDMTKLNKSTSPAETAMNSVSSQTTVVPNNNRSLRSLSQATQPLSPTSQVVSNQSVTVSQLENEEIMTSKLKELTHDPQANDHSSESYTNQLEEDVISLRSNIKQLVKIFVKITEEKRVWKHDYNGGSDTSDDEGEDRSNTLPQIYPRFIAGEFNGGNWCNPFFSQSNPVLNASGDELKNRYHSKIIIDRDAYKSILNFSQEMKKLSEDTMKYLDPKVQHNYFNDQLKGERNTHILRLIYKFLYYAGSVVDILEAFDFTVFCLIKRYKSNEEDVGIPSNNNDSNSNKNNSNLTFDYPVVLEFFQYKQHFHDLISEIVMATQSLTLEDPEVFKGMHGEDELLYDRDIMRDPKEKAAKLLLNILLEETTKVKGDAISLNADVLMSKSLDDGINFLDSILSLIQQLIDERETILNYATRVMHDDFNVQLLVIERNNTISSDKSDEYFSGGGQAEQGAAVMSSGNKKRDNTPWFLEGDEEYDLLLDIKGNIKGGSKEALIAHLTRHDLYDVNFNSAFLFTFPTIMSLSELISLLIVRYNIEAPEGLSYEEYNTWINKKQIPIRNRVLTLMKVLIEKFWAASFSKNKSVLKKWLQFIQTTPTVQNISTGKLVSSHLQKLLQGDIIYIEREPIIPNTKPPAPLVKGSLIPKKMKLLDIDYIELARQLTIREFKLYAKINKYTCLSKVWGRKSGINESIEDITNFIKSSNQLTNYAAYMILRKQEIRKRVQLIRFFVQVAEKCRQYNNYSSMTAIISALYSSPIHRLKKTWKLVSPDTLSHLQNMNKLMNSSRNFNEYRDVLKFIGSEPCVPFFGVYLSDLTFIFHGNSDILMNRSRMVNFAKRAKTFEIVTAMERFKYNGYNFLVVKEIQQYLDSWFGKCPTIDAQYQLSLNLEPKEVVKPGGNFRLSKSR